MKKVGSIGNKLSTQILRDHLGIHALLEVYDCPDTIHDIKRLEEGFCSIAKGSGATVVSSHFHQFSPFGVSGVVIIKESHFTIHTWPEYRYAAIDIFTCTDNILLDKAIDGLVDLMGSDDYHFEILNRGKRVR